LVYLSRYTHHAAIANNRPITGDSNVVTLRLKDYREKHRRAMTIKHSTNQLKRQTQIS
jgi:hypothetical protein